jgi:hypothetical protein
MYYFPTVLGKNYECLFMLIGIPGILALDSASGALTGGELTRAPSSYLLYKSR